MKTYNWEGVNPDGYFLDKLEPIPSALPSFFFNDTATTEIYTLSLHDALPIFSLECANSHVPLELLALLKGKDVMVGAIRSEEHTTELQSHCNIVCRLLLEKQDLEA